MSVIATYLNDNAQTPLGGFVVYMLHSPVVVEHFGFFSESHSKQSQHDVSLREWELLPGFVEIPGISNVD